MPHAAGFQAVQQSQHPFRQSQSGRSAPVSRSERSTLTGDGQAARRRCTHHVRTRSLIHTRTGSVRFGVRARAAVAHAHPVRISHHSTSSSRGERLRRRGYPMAAIRDALRRSEHARIRRDDKDRRAILKLKPQRGTALFKTLLADFKATISWQLGKNNFLRRYADVWRCGGTVGT